MAKMASLHAEENRLPDEYLEELESALPNDLDEVVTIDLSELEPMQRALLEAVLQQGADQERKRVIEILNAFLVSAMVDEEPSTETALIQELLQLVSDPNID